MSAGVAGISSAGEMVCTHCALPVPTGLIEPGAQAQFCCHGCRAAYSIIHSCGLDQYYRLVDRAGGRVASGMRAPVDESSDAYAELDHPAFVQMHSKAAGGELREIVFTVENMHCAACVWLLEKLPTFMPVVRRSVVRMNASSLTVEFDPAALKLSSLARTLASLGYPVHPARDLAGTQLRRVEDRKQLISIGIAGSLAANTMMFALAVYLGEAVGMEAAYERFFRWASMVLGVIALVGPGRVFFRSAYVSLRHGVPNLDVPIAAALLAGGVMGLIGTISATADAYFDSLAMLVFLLLVGRFIHHRQQRAAADSVELLFSLTSTSTHKVEGDRVIRVPLESVGVGDVVEVLAGDSIPVDGVVIRGETRIDRSLLTGESTPVRVVEGEDVPAGGVNLAAPIRVRVRATGADTRAGKLMRLVSEGSLRRAPIAMFTDRVAGWFIVATSALFLFTILAWWPIDGATALRHATSVVIVSCPCILGLAAPLIMSATVGRGARRGILIKGADVLERLSRPGTLVLDKTGTVTEGRARVVRFVGDEESLAIAGELERSSSHPLARAICQYAAGRGLTRDVGELENIQHVLGAGMACEVRSWPSGRCRRVMLGSPAFVLSGGCEMLQAHAPLVGEMVRQGNTPVMLAIDGLSAAVFEIGDPERADTAACIEAMRARGWNVELLSGDHEITTLAVGRRIGLAPSEIRGGVSPEQKLERVRELSSRGRVVMVGDGVNDAAALAAATVGVAVHRGAEASLAAADVYLARPGLEGLVELAEASRRSMHAVYASLVATTSYNVVAASLAVLGLIHPMIAALLMPLSSLTILVIALTWRTFPRERQIARGVTPASNREVSR